MLVTYVETNNYCFWVEETPSIFARPTLAPLPWEPRPPCEGWEQDTPRFKLVSPDKAYLLLRFSDRWKELFSR